MKRLSALTHTQKIALSCLCLLLAALLIGLGAYAEFNDSVSARQSVSSGTVVIDLATSSDVSGSKATGYTVVGASDLAPGDTVARPVDVKNDASTMAWGDLRLITEALEAGGNTQSTSTLVTDASGLKVSVQLCDGGTWSETSPGSRTYTCSGTASSLASDKSIYSSCAATCTPNDYSLLSSGFPASGASARLLVTLKLPAAADNALQGKSADIKYTFKAVQRAGENR